MKYFSRDIMVRKEINRFGRLGYVPVTELVATEDIQPFNYRKQIHFYEDRDAELYFSQHPDMVADTVYQIERPRRTRR